MLELLTDKSIMDRITNIQIINTKVSDHEAVMWVLETDIRRKTTPYNEITKDTIKDEKYKRTVREH